MFVQNTCVYTCQKSGIIINNEKHLIGLEINKPHTVGWSVSGVFPTEAAGQCLSPDRKAKILNIDFFFFFLLIVEIDIFLSF